MKIIFNNNIKAVIFDKDGTLLEMEKTWRPMVEKIAADMVGTFGFAPDDVVKSLAALGINDDGFTPDSIFVKDNFNTMVEAALCGHEINELKKQQLSEYFSMLLENPDKLIRPHVFNGVPETLGNLKSAGYILGLATSDRVEIADMHLQEGGLKQYFNLVLADDGEIRVKPHPEMLERFCSYSGFNPSEVAMVGDSMNDVLFGTENQMGCTVYVRSGYPDPLAEAKADIVIENVTGLIEH